jgi:hypothetical protein
MGEIPTSDAKLSTNQELREQSDASKLVIQGFEHQIAKLKKELQKNTVQENKIRNQVEMKFILEHEHLQFQRQELDNRKHQLSKAMCHYLAERSSEREEWNAHLAVTIDDVSIDDLSKDFESTRIQRPEIKDPSEIMTLEFRRRLTRLVVETEECKQYADGKVAKALADKKASDDSKLASMQTSLDQRSRSLSERDSFMADMLQKLRGMDANDTEARESLLRQGRAGHVLTPKPRKYTLDDPKIINLLKHRYLGG